MARSGGRGAHYVVPPVSFFLFIRDFKRKPNGRFGFGFGLDFFFISVFLLFDSNLIIIWSVDRCVALVAALIGNSIPGRAAPTVAPRSTRIIYLPFIYHFFIEISRLIFGQSLTQHRH